MIRSTCWILNSSLFVTIVAAAVLLAANCVSMTTSGGQAERTYHPNGALATEIEVDAQGAIHGRSREWYETGVLKIDGEYNHGQWVSIRTYSENGKLIREMTEGSDFVRAIRTFDD